MKKILYLMMFLPCATFAQRTNQGFANSHAFGQDETRAFDHIEVGATLGTPGVGVDIATPLSSTLKLRAGFSYMPTFNSTASFTMSSVGGNGNPNLDMTKTERLAQLLSMLVNINAREDNTMEVDNKVDMDRKLGYYNAKLLLDWYPFRSKAGKDWHFTAGFYVGSRQVATICNTIEEMPTTLAMNIYNNMYDQIQTLGPYEYPSFDLEGHFFELDPFIGDWAVQGFNSYGRVAVQMGQLENGNYFYIDPNRKGLLKAEAIVNSFKPYVGVGYSKRIGRDHRWNVGFDAGVMIWGTPRINCQGYEYKADEPDYDKRYERKEVDLVHDIKGVGGVVGDYLKVIKAFPILPVIEAKLSYSIF